ncbi:unnamed protein product [Arabidopsis halleri]
MWDPLVGTVGALQVISEPNPNKCGVMRAHTVGGNGLNAQRGRCDLLVGVNCNTQVSGIWWCMRRGLKELIWPPISP